MKVLKFRAGNQTATLTEENGTIVVVRGDSTQEFGDHHTLESVADKFKEYGWEPVSLIEPDVDPTVFHRSWLMNEVAEAPLQMVEVTAADVTEEEEEVEIPAEVQKEVDDYLAMYDQLAEMQKKAKALKDSVRKYMEENDLKEIYGTEDRKVYLQDSTKSNSSSTFTDYDYRDLAEVLKEPVLEEVTEMRVNADKLNVLLKSNKLPTKVVDQVKKLKITTPGTPQFKVKK